jgi:hypothetical protein
VRADGVLLYAAGTAYAGYGDDRTLIEGLPASSQSQTHILSLCICLHSVR